MTEPYPASKRGESASGMETARETVQTVLGACEEMAGTIQSKVMEISTVIDASLVPPSSGDAGKLETPGSITGRLESMREELGRTLSLVDAIAGHL